MVQRGRSMDTSTATSIPPRRQFTTSSRTKSTASFKGLRKVLTHESSTLMDSHRAKSMDTLVMRKLNMSGLNMTSLAKVKSNPNTTHSILSPKLKPRRTKSTHSVVSLRDSNDHGDLYKSDSSTDEEVEYFTEDEDIQKEEPEQKGEGKQVASQNKSVEPLSYKPPSELISHDAENGDRSTTQIDQTVGHEQEDDKINHSNIMHDDSPHKLTRQDNNRISATVASNISNGSDQYIPDVILSQSTGIEKKFENPSSIQNSLSNELHTNNKKTQSSYNPVELNNEPAGSTDKSNKNKGTVFSKSHSSLSNFLQKNNLHQSTNHNVAPKETNISNTSHLNSLFHSRKAFDSRASRAQGDINNFTTFLKSNNNNIVSDDRDSRTQKKLWLQRENSLLDLNLSNDYDLISNTSIESKRIFEKISHEYTNVRRFYNPIESSLLRFNKSEGNHIQPSSFSSSAFKIKEFLPTNNSKNNLQRVLSSIWKNELDAFNMDLARQPQQQQQQSQQQQQQQAQQQQRQEQQQQQQRHQSKFGKPNSSIQPTTRAVNKRFENQR
ncbi:hypothetical protein KAFR_0B06660 [Kazachstania africana CBS 2517]|uniref:Uncharacterized protein n=1 Tax=Kazachstania africana (strain ATCC 22294 / BCRC 22015 / CBS 2517 / CECT 1963 / NBRC 1671 / NRRL Y-8276) TaxID=1071382 RepID=H2ARG3_KAZAF|nr:hypothetical protein KAFR_0B06660 [Kazachstania africana CBS 2517]CCF56963.1 hypothetical protein KAFR_0B06660 [Kazachstania africana CBS 2517]